MNKLFYKIGERIEKTPIKTLLVFILIFAIMIAGAVNVYMATGNDTLVDSKNKAYIQNHIMEENFGGEAIMVLFQGEQDKLLDVDNLEKMWNIEKRLNYNEDIFSIMSPASIVNQMADKQSTEIKKQVLTISDGLGDMASKLTEIGEELKSKDIKDPKEMEEKLNNLSNISGVFNKLIDGQKSLGQGIGELRGGLTGISNGLSEVSTQLNQMGNQFQDNPQLKMQLTTISENVGKSANGLKSIAGKTDNIKAGTTNTVNGLSNIKKQLSSQTTEMKGSLSGGISPDELYAMANGFITMGENLDKLSDGLQTFHTKSDMMIADFPKEQKEIENILYDENGKIRSMFSDVLLDDTNNLMMIKLQGNLPDENKDIVYKQVKEALEKEDFKDISYMISGKPVLDSALRNEMQTNMKYMIVSAIALMFIILMLVFKIRWRVLSLGIIFVSVIATLGIMGHLNVPMTMVSMAVFPILIGLGIDYSIQFQNRYEEEKSTKTTLRQIGKAVGTAVIATVLGFISLYASPVPMIQDFGKMLTIGVIVSFIGSIFILMPILTSRDTLETQTGRKFKVIDENPTIIDRMLERSTKFISRYKIIVIILSISLAGFGLFADSKVGVETDIETFMPQDMDALSDIHYIRDIVGSTNQMAIFMEGKDLLNEQSINWMQSTISEIKEKFPEKIVDIKSIDNLVSNIENVEEISYEEYLKVVDDFPEKQRKMFINDDKTKGVILMNVEHMATEELQDFVSEVKDSIKDAPMNVSITGKSVLDVEMVKGLTEGRVKMTIIGIGLVFLALLILYRSLFKAFAAIFPIILIVGMSGGIMYLLGLKYTPITATLGALVLGMGTEMTIILLERYLEERMAGKDKLQAILVSVNKVGKATVASGLTTVGGFSVLMLSKFVILKDFGLMTVINISLALISTFIILPAIILVMDKWLLSKKERISIESNM